MQKKKTTIKEIKQAFPKISSEKIEVLADTLDEILMIKSVVQSEGGMLLMEVLKNNCSIALRKAIMAAKSGDKEALIPYILDYSANMDLLSTLKDVSLEKEIREQLDEAVLEEGI